jgi:hypothetical protein
MPFDFVFDTVLLPYKTYLIIIDDDNTTIKNNKNKRLKRHKQRKIKYEN